MTRAHTWTFVSVYFERIVQQVEDHLPYPVVVADETRRNSLVHHVRHFDVLVDVRRVAEEDRFFDAALERDGVAF